TGRGLSACRRPGPERGAGPWSRGRRSRPPGFSAAAWWTPRRAIQGSDLRPFYGTGPLSARMTPAIIQVDSFFIQTGRGSFPDEAHQPAARQHGGRRSGSESRDDEGGSVPPSTRRPRTARRTACPTNLLYGEATYVLGPAREQPAVGLQQKI